MTKAEMDRKPTLVAVKFLTYDAPFVAGHVEVFPRPTADRLVSSGVAEYAEATVVAVTHDTDGKISSTTTRNADGKGLETVRTVRSRKG